MGSVPVMHVFTTGEVVTASNLNNNTVTLANFVLAKPYAKVRQTAPQLLTNGTFAALSWNSADLNTDSMWSAGSPTRLTAQTPGWYEYSGKWELVAGVSTGGRGTCLAVTGTQVPAGQVFLPGTAASAAGLMPNHPLFMNVNDYAELQAFHDSGSNQNTGSASSLSQAWFKGAWAHN